MKRKIYWEHDATEQVTRLATRNPRQATRILIAVREFGQGSRGNVKKLVGDGRWRLRVGDWRVLFRLLGEAVYISEVSDRQDAYD